MTEVTQAEEVFVDPKVEYHGVRMVPAMNSTMPLIRAAASSAVSRCIEDGREPVMVEVIVRVKPQ